MNITDSRLKGGIKFARYFLLLVPALAFFFVLNRYKMAIPICDDYAIVLAGASHLSTSPGILPKLEYILTATHNNYKLMFENAVIVTQYELSGKVSFLPLANFGNSLAILLFIVIACMSPALLGDRDRRWLYLFAISCLVFQLQYAGALDYASSSLQHLAVVVFSLLSIVLLTKEGQASFAAGCIAYILAIASSPNGFFVFLPILLFLLQTRRFSRSVVWLLLTAGMLGIYLYKYPEHFSEHGGSAQHAAALTHYNLSYALSFLGASAAYSLATVPSIVWGIVLCGFFVLAAVRRYYRRNPAVFYGMMVILINAVAVSGFRSDLGVAQSLSSRYREHSCMYVALAFIFVLEELVSLLKAAPARRAVVASLCFGCVAFCVLSDLGGARFLREKRHALIDCYRVEWQKDPTASDTAEVEGTQLENGVHIGTSVEVNLPAINEAVRTGVFDPPQF